MSPAWEGPGSAQPCGCRLAGGMPAPARAPLALRLRKRPLSVRCRDPELPPRPRGPAGRSAPSAAAAGPRGPPRVRGAWAAERRQRLRCLPGTAASAPPTRTPGPPCSRRGQGCCPMARGPAGSGYARRDGSLKSRGAAPALSLVPSYQLLLCCFLLVFLFFNYFMIGSARWPGRRAVGCLEREASGGPATPYVLHPGGGG